MEVQWKEEIPKYVMSDDCKMNTHFVPLTNRIDLMKWDFVWGKRTTTGYEKRISIFASFYGGVNYYIIPLLTWNWFI